MLLSVDVETGGLPEECSLLTVGLVFQDIDLYTTCHLKVKPKDGIYRVQPEAMQINGINLEEHDKVAHTYEYAGTEIYKLLQAHYVPHQPITVVGKNTYFDLCRIWQHLIRRATWEQFCSYRIVDLNSNAHMFQQAGLLPPDQNMSLTGLAQAYGVELLPLHDALNDAKMTLQIYQAMCRAIKGSSDV